MGRRWDVFGGIALFLYLGSPFPLISSPSVAHAWDNGGRSKKLSDPAYGVHDWIGESAVNLLPQSSQYDWLRNNLSAFLIGTEAPDNAFIARKFFGRKRASLSGGYGDRFHHHVYFLPKSDSLESLVSDDVGAVRAEEEFGKAVQALIDGDERLAAFYAGAFSHYAGDLANKAHTTPEEYVGDHNALESAVARTITARLLSDHSRVSAVFQRFIPSASLLEDVSAYDASLSIALRTFESEGFVVDGEQLLLPFNEERGLYIGCDSWPEGYVVEVGELLGYAVGQVSSVLHTITLRAEVGRVAASRASDASSHPSEALLLNARQ